MKNKMKQICIFLIISFSAAFGIGTNPFLSEQNASVIPPQPFEREDINFTSDARMLKDITITYIKLDGSEETMVLDINKSIDWHDTYKLIRAKSPQTSKMLDAPATIAQPSETPQSADIELPINAEQIYDLLAYTIYKNRIKIATTDEMISDFSIGNPSKIVLDFKNESVKPSKNIKIANSIIRRIDFGSHKNYYRLVIYLDGKYTYKINRDKNGYELRFE